MKTGKFTGTQNALTRGAGPKPVWAAPPKPQPAKKTPKPVWAAPPKPQPAKKTPKPIPATKRKKPAKPPMAPGVMPTSNTVTNGTPTVTKPRYSVLF